MLYPVGPLPPRVYWVRRGVVLGVPLIVILIIAVSCGGGGGNKPPAANGAGSNPPTSPTDSASANPNTPCVPGDLSAQLAVAASNNDNAHGATPDFSATIKNVSLSPCTFTSTAANESWTVITGVDKFWTTAGCPTQDSSSSKVLQPGATRRLSIQWDGKRLDPGCKPGSEATAGTYRLRATLDGVKARQVIFYINTNTQ